MAGFVVQPVQPEENDWLRIPGEAGGGFCKLSGEGNVIAEVFEVEDPHGWVYFVEGLRFAVECDGPDAGMVLADATLTAKG